MAEITEPMKANWAMAHVKVQHLKELREALKRACVAPGGDEIGAVPPREAVEEVGRLGRVIALTSDRALELLDHPNPGAASTDKPKPVS